MPGIESLKIIIVRVGIDWTGLCLFGLSLRFQTYLHLLRNGFSQLPLHLQKVSKFPIKTLRPNMRLIPDTDQLRTNAGASSLATYAAFQDATGVTWINGVGGGILMALGSLCGTFIPGDWDRRLMYALAGAMNALAAIMLLAANRPSLYLVGTALYLITNGFCAVWFTALMAEIVGSEARDASTLFTVLNSAGSLPVLYMIRLDGIGYRYFGTHGLLWTDALAVCSCAPL